ncbi:MAG: hypothetical protein HYZ50_24925 [Deltaproteobacteria bacterium]|nr:hypothetical protein [Deltaproteobacteria bacterium]
MFARASLFLARRRLFACVLGIALALPAAWWARQASFSSKLSDYYPAQHPHVRLYQEFTDMLKMTNTVVVTVTVREGTIFTSGTLDKVHRLTVSLIETKGVNPFEVMSLTHPRLKNISVRSEGINILPIVEHPEQPHTPEQLAQIKSAVYTNLGVRGVYVAPDEKTALIRAGFWEGMAEPRAVLARLHALIDKERDANTEIDVTGNLILAAWLIEAAPRFLLLMLVSAIVALVCISQATGFLSCAVAALAVNLFGALWGFGVLGLKGLAFDPLALIALFALGIRGVTIVVAWASHLARTHGTLTRPFAPEEHRDQVIERTAATLGRPLMTALCIDGAALFALTRSDVPALQSLGYLGAGWMAGLFLSLWTVLPLWSSFVSLRNSAASWGVRAVARGASLLQAAGRLPAVASGGIVLLLLLGGLAAIQLQAGKAMWGTSLFYPSHPFNRATSLVNRKFIGGNQLIVIARAPGEAAFRDPRALRALDAFQHHMAEDAQFGGSMAITSLAKSVTRMFHEDVPKWEIIPDDMDSAGQIIFRIISSAATPTEVERFLSTDYHTTTVSFFYRDYSPEIMDRVLTRARTFIAQHQNGGNSLVQFRVGGGILGILSAVHSAVEGTYWRFVGALFLLVALGGLVAGKSLRSMLRLALAVVLSQGVLLSLLWLGGIDFNMYTLPAIVVGAGAILLPTLLTTATGTNEPLLLSALVAISVVVIAAGAVWLLSPLRLQADMGMFFIGLAIVMTGIPLLLASYFREAA